MEDTSSHAIKKLNPVQYVFSVKLGEGAGETLQSKYPLNPVFNIKMKKAYPK